MHGAQLGFSPPGARRTFKYASAPLGSKSRLAQHLPDLAKKPGEKCGLTRRIGPEHTILIDGAEQLGPWSWWRIRWLTRHAGTIVITSHSPGRLPTIHECTTDVALLEELVRELAPEVAETVDLVALFHRHCGNVRLCFRELYDAFSK